MKRASYYSGTAAIIMLRRSFPSNDSLLVPTFVDYARVPLITILSVPNQIIYQLSVTFTLLPQGAVNSLVKSHNTGMLPATSWSGKTPSPSVIITILVGEALPEVFLINLNTLS